MCEIAHVNTKMGSSGVEFCGDESTTLMLLDRECTDMIFIPQRIKIGDHTQQLFLPKFKIDK
jgi:hypothetical protein